MVKRIRNGVEIKPKKAEFLTTRQVADLTSLSLGTIQKMVDGGVFQYYLTWGGHRRILRSSVDEYMSNRAWELGQ